MSYSADIAEQKQEILDLLEKLHQGSAKTKAIGREGSETEMGGPSLQDRIRRRRQDLLDLKDRREKLGQDLLEERLLNICQMLEERISKIESVIQSGSHQAGRDRETETSDGMDIASNLDEMAPDLDIAIPGMEETSRAAETVSQETDSSLVQENAAQDGPPAALSGLIQDGILPDILQMISANTKSGIFTLLDEETQIDLFFQEGEMYHAITEDMIGQTAFFAAMALEEGQFFFRETDALPEEKTIDGNTQFMILEALRQIDEDQGGS